MQTSYYNTTGESGPQLSLNLKSNIKQDKRILNYFKAHKDGIFSPSDIHKECFNNDGLLTSVRRAIDTLVNNMEIIRVGYKKSPHDRKEFTYQLNSEIITK